MCPSDPFDKMHWSKGGRNLLCIHIRLVINKEFCAHSLAPAGRACARRCRLHESGWHVVDDLHGSCMPSVFPLEPVSNTYDPPLSLTCCHSICRESDQLNQLQPAAHRPSSARWNRNLHWKACKPTPAGQNACRWLRLCLISYPKIIFSYVSSNLSTYI